MATIWGTHEFRCVHGIQEMWLLAAAMLVFTVTTECATILDLLGAAILHIAQESIVVMQVLSLGRR